MNQKRESPAKWAIVIFSGLMFLVVLSYLGDFHFPMFSKGRSPQAVPDPFDLSHLEGQALDLALKTEIIQGADLIYEPSRIGIQFTHFTLKGRNLQSVNSCDVFKEIELRFEAEDAPIVAGDKAKMVVTAPCKINMKDNNKMEPIWVPLHKIISSPAKDSDFIEGLENSLKVSFRGISNDWPRKWVLVGLELKGVDTKVGDLSIMPDEIYEISKGTEPLTLRF